MSGELFEIAAQTRQDFIIGNIDRNLLGELYVAYNPSAKEGVDEFIDQALEIFPLGSCGLTSVYMQDRLQKGEIKKGQYDGQDHTLFLPFNRIGNFVIDITADQFGGPPVYVGPIKPPWKVV